MWLIILLIGSFASPPGSLRVSESCQAAVNSKLPGWRPAEPTEDVAAWAKLNNLDPFISTGDFDGDGARDTAILLEHEDHRKVAVCLSSRPRISLRIISEPYCDDLIFTSPANSNHYNYDTGKTEKIKNDGISVSCFEKAGATYVYENGRFRQIVDSD